MTARPPTGMARIDEVFLDGRRRTVVADVFGGAEASPDGRRIAALATDEEDRRVRPRVFARDGRRIAQIELEGQRLAWSPDGRSLAIGAREGLFVVSADGGSPRRIAGFERPVFTGIDWSPDGGTLAVSWFREGRGD